MEERQVVEHFLASRTEEAFGVLFEAVYARVRRYFMLRGLDSATAEDLSQNVFVKVYQQAGDLREVESFYGWLFAIARNERISYWRREHSRSEKVQFESLGDQDSDRLITEPDVIPAMHLMELLRSLEPAERDLVLLRFVEGLSYEELAVALEIPLGTVKWRVFNTRKKLSRLIGKPSGCQEQVN